MFQSLLSPIHHDEALDTRFLASHLDPLGSATPTEAAVPREERGGGITPHLHSV